MAASSKKRRKRRRRPAAGAPRATAPRASAPSPRAAAPRRGSPDARPPAPWGSFPLVEVTVLVALVMLIGGFFVQGQQGAVMVGVGLVLGSLGGLELTIREHFAGYRSHTLVLAAAPALVVLGALTYFAPDGFPIAARFAIAAAVLGLAAFGLTRAFRSRAGVAIKLR